MSRLLTLVSTDAAHADFVSVGGVSAQFANITMAAGEFYVFVSSTDCWVQQGVNPTASAAAGSTFVPAGALVHIHGGIGAKLSVIQDTGPGKASLTRVQVF